MFQRFIDRVGPPETNRFITGHEKLIAAIGFVTVLSVATAVNMPADVQGENLLQFTIPGSAQVIE